jgi:hypothetical protein
MVNLKRAFSLHMGRCHICGKEGAMVVPCVVCDEDTCTWCGRWVKLKDYEITKGRKLVRLCNGCKAEDELYTW